MYNFIPHNIISSYEAIRTLKCPMSLCTASSIMLIYKRREENQLDATECFIAIKIRSTCFGHSYAHHQELETILVLLSHMVCNALIAGGRLLGAKQQAIRVVRLNFPQPGRIACCYTPNSRPPATKVSHTICGNNTSIVSSS